MTDLEIVNMYLGGKPTKDILKQAGFTAPSLYYILRKHGIKSDRKESILDRNIDDVMAMLEAGYTKKEIGNKYGVSASAVKDFKRRHNVQNPNNVDIERIIQNLNDLYEDLEYINGYTNSKSVITIRCKVCGATFERAHDFVRRGIAKCPACYEAEQNEQRQARERDRERKRKEEREQKRKEAERERIAKIEARRHDCPVCGTSTTRRKYCSDKCSRKLADKNKEIKRRDKINSAMIDKDINLLSLYKRDKGICYLCGKKCNYEDYVIADGAFIAGNWYPSIDHVKQLAKGGKHSWDNVRLAHRICNSIKR